MSNRKVIDTARSMIEDGNAIAIMGNHELNAILFHEMGPDEPPREHSDKNLKQHSSFLSELPFGSAAAEEVIDFFLTLPLFVELEGIRLVHACWDKDAIDAVLDRIPDARLTRDILPEIAKKKSELARAVVTLLNAPEVPLPEGFSFRDKGGHERTEIRLRWWGEHARTWRDAALSVPDPASLPATDLPDAWTFPRIHQLPSRSFLDTTKWRACPPFKHQMPCAWITLRSLAPIVGMGSAF